MQKVNNKVLWVVIAVLFIIVIGVASNKPAETKTEVKPAETVKAVEEPVKAEETPAVAKMRESYMGGCDEDGTMNEYCTCTFDYMIDVYGAERFLSVAVEYSETEEFTSTMKSAMTDCIHLIK